MLHRVFWLIYGVFSVLFFVVSGYFESKTTMNLSVYGFITATIFILFQEALFLYFILIERMYLPYLGSGYFHSSLVVSNLVVFALLAVAVLWNKSPACLSEALLSGWGLVGGNLGCALILSLAFGFTGLFWIPGKHGLRGGKSRPAI